MSVARIFMGFLIKPDHLTWKESTFHSVICLHGFFLSGSALLCICDLFCLHEQTLNCVSVLRPSRETTELRSCICLSFCVFGTIFIKVFSGFMWKYSPGCWIPHIITRFHQDCGLPSNDRLLINYESWIDSLFLTSSYNLN